jgi:serine/threonine protein kinase
MSWSGHLERTSNRLTATTQIADFKSIERCNRFIRYNHVKAAVAQPLRRLAAALGEVSQFRTTRILTTALPPMPAPQLMYDVFISHSSRDKATAREVARRLQDHGLRVWFDDWCIGIGESIPAAIEHGLETSRNLLLLLSHAALDSQWVTLERQAALFHDPTNLTRRLIPVATEEISATKLPFMLRAHRVVSWNRLSSEDFTSLLEACRPNASVQTLPVDDPIAHNSITYRQAQLTQPLTRQRRTDEHRRMLNDRLGDRFEIHECLSEDPEDTMFRARDLMLQRDVALKIPVLPSFDAEIAVSHFRKKMQAVAMISHSNISPVLAGMEIDHLPILVLGFIDGVTLRQLIERTGCQPLRRIHQMLMDVTRALRYANRRNAIHHRLRSSNIIFDSEGKTVVTTMNFAGPVPTWSAFEHDPSHALERRQYDAPEQLPSETSTAPHTSDQYSLGLLALEMLVGHSLTDCRDVESFTRSRRRLSRFAEILGQARPNCPKKLRDVISTLISRHPQKRYRTLEQLEADLSSLTASDLNLRGHILILAESRDPINVVLAHWSLLRLRASFFQRVYDRLLKHASIPRVLEALGLSSADFVSHHRFLREAIERLIAFYDEGQRRDSPLFKKTLDTLRTLSLSGEAWTHFETSLLDSIAEECDGPKSGHNRLRLGQRSRASSQPSTSVKAWWEVLQPGLDFLRMRLADSLVN